jgi:hypothetical protein
MGSDFPKIVMETQSIICTRTPKADPFFGCTAVIFLNHMKILFSADEELPPGER